jgi:hypothetical protein
MMGGEPLHHQKNTILARVIAADIALSVNVEVIY